MRKHKYRWGNGFAFGEEKDMKMLEKMAANGYALVDMNDFGIYRFERAQPEECSYSVDYFEAKTGSEEHGEYIEIFESGGWKHVCSACGFYHWFKASKGTTPIYTDNDDLSLKHVKMRRVVVKCILGGLLMAIVFFALAEIVPRPVAIVFSGIAGGATGLALTLAVGLILTHRRILRLKNLQNKL